MESTPVSHLQTNQASINTIRRPSYVIQENGSAAEESAFQMKRTQSEDWRAVGARRASYSHPVASDVDRLVNRVATMPMPSYKRDALLGGPLSPLRILEKGESNTSFTIKDDYTGLTEDELPTMRGGRVNGARSFSFSFGHSIDNDTASYGLLFGGPESSSAVSPPNQLARSLTSPPPQPLSASLNKPTRTMTEPSSNDPIYNPQQQQIDYNMVRKNFAPFSEDSRFAPFAQDRYSNVKSPESLASNGLRKTSLMTTPQRKMHSNTYELLNRRLSLNREPTPYDPLAIISRRPSDIYNESIRSNSTHSIAFTSSDAGFTPVPITPSPATPKVSLITTTPTKEHSHFKGGPGSIISHYGPLYVVEFKSGRRDIFYLDDKTMSVADSEFVIVEGDRGLDLGKVVSANISNLENLESALPGSTTELLSHKKEPKAIYRRAQNNELAQLAAKLSDEAKAIITVSAKVKERGLPMEIVDAEYQWDRKKMTFYFNSQERIDFRDLVKDLFKVYKARIWMCAADRR